MAETILTPGQGNGSQQEQTPVVNSNYLTKDNMLSEFQTESEKSVARYNLGVPSAEDVYTKEEVEPVIIDRIKKKIAESLDSSDFITRVAVEALLESFVRLDGSTPFKTPQAGVEPKASHDLTTKQYVDSLIQTCLKQVDKNKILEQVENLLKDYVKENDVYTKDDVYTKGEIDDKNTQFMKSDGTTPFTRPVSGRTPNISSHLTTKKYVDDLLETHKQDIDPHGFITKLTNKLKRYALSDQVYNKEQTYSRGQIDYIIDKLVAASVEEALGMHLTAEDPHGIIDKVKEIGYVLPNGTTPFRAPQKSVDAVNPQDLVTLHQVEEKIGEQLGELEQPVWITSGPVEAQVGMVKEGDTLASSVTFQEAMDAIFYGKRVKLTVPELSNIGESFPITLCIQGSLATVDYAEIWQDGNYLATITKENLEESGCVTIDGLPIDSNSEVKAKVFYTNGSIHEVIETVSVALPVFIGIIPRWKFGNTVTYNQLLELSLENPKNNKFYDKGIHLQSIEHSYNFDEDREQKIIVALPVTYNNLAEMSNSAQVVTSDAFEVIDQIPFQVPGSTSDIIYKIYIYKQDLYSLNTTMKFKFA